MRRRWNIDFYSQKGGFRLKQILLTNAQVDFIEGKKWSHGTTRFLDQTDQDLCNRVVPSPTIWCYEDAERDHLRRLNRGGEI